MSIQEETRNLRFETRIDGQEHERERRRASGRNLYTWDTRVWPCPHCQKDGPVEVLDEKARTQITALLNTHTCLHFRVGRMYIHTYTHTHPISELLRTVLASPGNERIIGYRRAI